MISPMPVPTCPIVETEFGKFHRDVPGQAEPDRSRVALRRLRSLLFARRIAAVIIGAINLKNPPGLPRLRRSIRVPPESVSYQA